MKLQHLNTAIAEAERFLKRAKDLRESHFLGAGDAPVLIGHEHIRDHPKQAGATKRSSMDLTRALAELRGRAK